MAKPAEVSSSKSSFRKCKRKRTQTPPKKVPGEVEKEDVVEVRSSPKHNARSSCRIWKNLDLALSVQSKELSPLTKIDLAFNFVSSECGKAEEQCFEPLQISRLASLLGGWIQNVMISKKLDSWDPCLDIRCWVVLKFCLEKASFSISAKFLGSVTHVLSHGMSEMVSGGSLNKEDSVEFYKVVLGCLSLLFNAYDGTINNVGSDLWISCASASIDLIIMILSNNISELFGSDVLICLSCIVLEQFASFLRVQPNPKQIFISFVDSLLESSMKLDVMVHSRTRNPACVLERKLFGVIEDVLSNGLFHSNPVHINGFLSMRSLYMDPEGNDSKHIGRSYHRHLFKKVNKIVARKSLAMSGLGNLFRLFVRRVKKKMEDHVPEKISGASKKHDEISTEFQVSSQPIFEVFMLVMEPLIIKCGELDFVEHGRISQPALIELQLVFESINQILANFVHEKLYSPAEDIDEANYIFLKEVYSTFICVSGKLYPLLSLDSLESVITNTVTLLLKELVVSIGYLIEIEFKVVGDDLVPIWLFTLSSLSIYMYMDDTKECWHLIKSEIFNLGCQIIKLFTDLRQVLGSPIFALFKAVRFFLSGKHGEIHYPWVLPCRYLSAELRSKAVQTLLFSQELRSASFNALRSVPEGQASYYIEQLTLDFKESLQWLKDGEILSDRGLTKDTSLDLYIHAEILGILSVQYSVLLDAIIITQGNSNSVGKAIMDLIAAMAPNITRLIGCKQKSADEFMYSVTGRSTLYNKITASGIGSPRTNLDASWIIVFFFRTYISCRSLYKQAIGFMPQNSRKAAATLGSIFTICHGENWIGKTEWRKRSYFSLMTLSSNSLQTIIQIVSESLFPNNKISHAPLVYVLLEMSLQRLVDLNRQIKGFVFLLEREEKSINNVIADTQKIRKQKWRKLIEDSKQEALDLTGIMIQYLPSRKTFQSVEMCNDTWDFCTCSLNEKSLPIATFWLLSQNLDVWSCHTTGKTLRKFLSLAICSVVMHKEININETNKQRKGTFLRNEVTVKQISSELLTDTSFHEHESISRLFVKGFLHCFKESLSSLFSYFGEAHKDLEVLSDWSDKENVLDKISLDAENVLGCSFSTTFHGLPRALCHLEHHTVTESFGLELETCQNLLNLLSGVIKFHKNVTSASLLTAYILNLERLIISSLRRYREQLSSSDHFRLLRLFISCRRTLRYLSVVPSNDSLSNKCSLLEKTQDMNVSIVSWLINSTTAVVLVPDTFSDEEHQRKIKDNIYVLFDHTAYLFFMLTKGLLIDAMSSYMSSEVPYPELTVPSELCEKDSDNCSNLIPNSFDHNDVWEQFDFVGNKLKKECKKLQDIYKGCMHNAKLENSLSIKDWYRLSSTISCVQGFLWGLVSSLNISKGTSKHGASKLMLCIYKFNKYINACEGFITFYLNQLFLDSTFSESWKLGLDQECNSSNPNAHGYVKDGIENFTGRQHNSKESTLTDGHTSDMGGDYKRLPDSDATELSGIKKRKLTLVMKDEVTALRSCHLLDLSKLQDLNITLLRKLLAGENPEMAFLIRQTFVSSAAILKLKHCLGSEAVCNHLQICSTNVLVRTACFILSELANDVGIAENLSYVWLDGTLKYLQEVSHCVFHSDPVLYRSMYADIIDVHMRTIGKCISLQGRNATLASHEIGSNTKMLLSDTDPCQDDLQYLNNQKYSLNDFKARLRKSFRKFIKRASGLYLLSAVQALERALVGVQRHCNMIYDITVGAQNDGSVSSEVAAGIDCLDSFLEFASGKKHLGVIKRHVQDLMGALFNIILHVQSPAIFYQVKVLDNISEIKPDSGSVILMCVEVLTKVIGKNDLFHMESCFIGESFHLPMAIFRDFHQFLSRGKGSMVRVQSNCVDRQFCVDLYAACCKLLCATLRHHKRESGRCVALLEDSVNTLLGCLETVNADSTSNEDLLIWETRDAAKCATFLRRVYEEMRQQKDLLGRYSSHFLSTYISVSSRFGPFKSGIKREVEEALVPGVYALLDICPPSDLQQLHTVLAEGPCRKKLADLQHDYKLKFLYEGKI